jgi:hypothetical protein
MQFGINSCPGAQEGVHACDNGHSRPGLASEVNDMNAKTQF